MNQASKTILNVKLLLPEAGPSRHELHAVARGLGRNVSGFMAYALRDAFDTLHRGSSEDLLLLHNMLAVQLQILRISTLATHHLTLTLYFDPEGYDLSHLDELSAVFGVTRDLMLSAMVLIAYDLEQQRLNDPQEQEYWCSVSRAASEELARRQAI